jgi:hypothetical protein
VSLDTSLSPRFKPPPTVVTEEGRAPGPMLPASQTRLQSAMIQRQAQDGRGNKLDYLLNMCQVGSTCQVGWVGPISSLVLGPRISDHHQLVLVSGCIPNEKRREKIVSSYEQGALFYW